MTELPNSARAVVIGGGIVGAATMYKIQKAYPNLSILLIEKESKYATSKLFVV